MTTNSKENKWSYCGNSNNCLFEVHVQTDVKKVVHHVKGFSQTQHLAFSRFLHCFGIFDFSSKNVFQNQVF